MDNANSLLDLRCVDQVFSQTLRLEDLELNLDSEMMSFEVHSRNPGRSVSFANFLHWLMPLESLKEIIRKSQRAITGRDGEECCGV
jgi:hypothetical protein